MLGAYLTLAETGRVLGVGIDRVMEFIDRKAGDLVAIQRESGLMVHEDDLRAFRRPLFIAASESEGLSALCQLATADAEESRPLPGSLQLATHRARGVANRNTLASAGFRALRDHDAVLAASARFDRLTSPEPTSGCLLWTGAMDRHGYGYFRLTSKVVVFAHRYAFVRANGPITESLDVDHRCHLRGCVEDRHLDALTHAENLRRRDARLAALGTHNMVAARAALTGRHLRLVGGAP